MLNSMGTHRKLSAFVLLFLISGFSGCATTHRAQSKAERAERASELFDQLDTNHDGYLSRAELLSGLRFAGTPEINPNLMYGLESSKAKKKIKASRKLSEAEIQKAMAEAFGVRDDKLDQRISREDFKKVVVERSKGADGDPFDPFM